MPSFFMTQTTLPKQQIIDALNEVYNINELLKNHYRIHTKHVPYLQTARRGGFFVCLKTTKTKCVKYTHKMIDICSHNV